MQALSELQSRAAHNSLCLLAQAAVHVHTHNLCLHTEQGQGYSVALRPAGTPLLQAIRAIHWPNTNVLLGVVPGSY